MATEQVGVDRHRPTGDWVQIFPVACLVAGLNFCGSGPANFLLAVRKAERNGWHYTVRLEREPTNKADANAIKVIGVSEVAGWFRRRAQEWHIGYVNRDDAAIICNEVLAKGGPLSAELYKIYIEPSGWTDIRFIPLSSSPYSHSSRSKRRG
ncbi:HIRAN domain-containing protein [Devosia sp. Root105]|uniref:HIRAN domain-containing protein n=1 Tax=Devosia sp. Root105 TaxID=1736423 RepID=UPI000A6E4A6A|nr:HIRAN domain-containing protein [Devosia sp. Root105]